MAILISIDETDGLQSTSGGGVTSTDTTAPLPERYDAVLSLETAGGGTTLGTAVSGASASDLDGVNVITFSDPVTDVSLVNASGDEFTGELSGLKTADGHDIKLYTSTLDNNVLLGKDSVTGQVIFAVILDTGVATAGTDTDVGSTGAKLWVVQYGALYQPNASDPNDVVSLQDKLFIGVDSITNFSLSNAPAGQNLFMMFGDGTPSTDDVTLVVTSLNAAGGGTVNTGLGGGGTTLGTDNQMIVPGKGLVFSFVTGANTNYTVPNLDQNEADVAANIQFDAFYGTSQATFSVVQLQPPKDATMTLTAFSEGDDSESGSAYIPGMTDGDESQVNILSVSIVRGGSTITLAAATGTVTTGTGGAQIWANFTNNTVVLKGIEAGDRITYVTDGNHNRVMIANTGDPKDNVYGASFDIGGFSIQGGSISSVGIEAIGFVDDAPTASSNADVLLDDDALTGGNPGGTADRDPDTAHLTGTLGLTFGTDGASAGTPLAPAVAWSATGAPDGFTYELALNGDLLIKQDGNTVITLTVDTDGNYTVTQNRALMHEAGGNDETGASFTVHYVVTDADGDQAVGDLSINVNDDTPTASASLNEASVVLDESLVDAGSDGNATADDLPPQTNPFAIAYGTPFGVMSADLVDPGSSSSYGADGAGATTMDLVITDGNGTASGLTTTAGDPIHLFMESDGTVTGRVNGSDGEVAFAIAIDDAGHVTVAQYMTLDHPQGGSEHDDWVDLAGKLGATVTLTDADHDATTSDAQDIGAAIRFEDDGPTASVEWTEARVVLDESLVDHGSDGNATTDNAPPATNPFTSDYGDPFGVMSADLVDPSSSTSYGHDGAGSMTMALVITAGDGSDSGLTTTAGESIDLFMESDGTVTGRIDGSDGEVAFAIAIDDDGNVTVAQYMTLSHPQGGSEHDDWVDLAGKLDAALTVTDADEDTATSTALAIGAAIRFEDDGPTASAQWTEARVVLDESLVEAGSDGNATTDNAPPETNPFTSDYGDPFGVMSADLVDPGSSTSYGHDGAGSMTMALVITDGNGSNSGLTTTAGDVIHLYMELNGEVTGRLGGSDGEVAFAIAIDDDGNVTVAQYMTLSHPQGGSEHDDWVDLADKLDAVLTVTDADEDTATSTALAIGAAIRFEDDGPTASVEWTEARVVLDESLVDHGSDGNATTDNAPPKTNPFTSDYGDPFGVMSADVVDPGSSAAYGHDGAGTMTMSLVLTDGSDSDLTTTAGDPIGLYLESDGTVTGRVDGSDGDVAFAIAIDDDGNVTVAQYMTLSHPQGGSEHDDWVDLAGKLGAVLTVTDADEDTASSTALDIGAAIRFEDDGPTASAQWTEARVVLDESLVEAGSDGNATADNAPPETNPFTSDYGDPFGVMSADLVDPGSSTSYGHDGAGTMTMELVITDGNGSNSGLTTTAGDVIHLYMESDGTVTGRIEGSDGEVAFAIAIDDDGNVTVAQYMTLSHPQGGSEHDDWVDLADKLDAVLTVTDADEDTATSTALAIGAAIRFEDDGPTASVEWTQARVVLDESETVHGTDPNATTDNAPPKTNPFASAYGTAFGVMSADLVDPGSSNTYGHDGAGTMTMDLVITDGDGSDSGLSTTAGDMIKLYLESDGTVTGRVGGSDGDVAFAIAIDDDGNVTVAQYLALNHPDGGDSHDESVDLTGKLGAVLTVTDADEDTATSQALDIGAAIVFEDDGPRVAINALVVLDDDDVDASLGNPGGPGDNDPAHTTGTLAVDFGRDGAGSVAWVTEGTAPDTFTYALDGDDLVILQNGNTVMTLTLALGLDGLYHYEVMQNAPLMHPEGMAENNLVFEVRYRVTDGDEDTATGSLMISVDDDTPIVVSHSDLIYAGGSNPVPGGTGYFAYSIGADQHRGTWSESNSDFASITLSGTLGTFAISNTSVTWLEEDEHHAVFHVAFAYMTNGGSGSTASEGGTLTFDKDAGTYHLSLGSPFPLVPLIQTAGSHGFTGYEQDSYVTDKTQPLVSVATVTNGFYVQFTGYHEPGAGTGKDNLVAGGTPGANVFTAGELFTQARTWVSVSGTAMGVAGDTIQKGEVLDMDFFNANPYGFSGAAPTKAVEGFYLKFDGISHDVSSGEDFVVLLKLVDALTGAHTTRAVVVDNLDIFVKNDPNIPVPLAYSGIPLDNNDGLVVIERNDYNGTGENWLVEGAQVLVSTEGITGMGINLNPLTGSTGGNTTVMEAFSDPVNTKPKGNSINNYTTDNDVMKLTSVGFFSSFTPDADLQFNVVLQDADGDVTPTQQLDVTVVGGTIFNAGTDWEAIQGLAGQADVFVFASVAASPQGDLHDVIGNFETGMDRINLVGIDAKTASGTDDAFSWISGAAFSGVAGQLRFDDASHLLQGDVNGDGVADFVVEVTGVTAASLSAGNFML